ncbi:DMP19 family protein [Porphyrobacter sp. ULC335]|uniref:DMP19 family protein n=1 Tax=Porphyrobacter sp. ULC335 TaxID=2854260 RepID=UPI00221E8C8A|nr:DMP19 family protein [Porphyrobacter sp. ULC335]UYV16843.1 DMP19 family protein [Porphyrobacter sp. ULC335]
MSKVACTQCSAMILPRTAAETGGICMACKQGIRASMEASREFYRKLKEYDPHRELWIWLVREVQANPGLANLSEAHRHYFAVGVLEGEVYNGGFHQYFWNSSGTYYADAIAGLKALEAETSLLILQAAARLLFGATLPPVDRHARWTAMKRRERLQGWLGQSGKASAKLDKLDKSFWEDPDRLGEKLTAFAQQSGILKPFEKEV